MILQIDQSFVKDVKKQKNPSLNKKVRKLIERLQNVDSLDQISNVKKLTGEENLYGIRMDDYRIGLIIKNEIT